ncbi:MAG: FKBP-type peptidyl-prolyl cis-trans isomerase, partial [Muribaculaceae bacterium]|nr:FKBP-type peptidyl-prolyl cis-trans isomerase [Muribaculaceae bacterium]
YVLNDFQRFDSTMQNERTKNGIAKGVQLAFANADDEAVIMGLQVGGQMLRELKSFEEQGVEVNREEILRNFRKVFMADTLDMNAMREFSMQMNTLMTKVEQIKAEKEAELAAQAPEAIQNEKAGKEYIQKLKAADPEVKTSESGLSYKIIEAGEPVEITDNSMVKVKYTGKLVDGTVFDQSPEDSPATFSPRGVVPGFGEGLKLLGKGGKAVLYIPADLAYGIKGVPQAGIGPNATLVFEVEVIDVNNN